MKKITILGIGMGNVKNITLKGIELLKEANLVIGAKRMVDSLKDTWNIDGKEAESIYAIKSKDILDAIVNYDKQGNIVILMSGDTGFFSGTKKLIHALDEMKLDYEVVAGISSISYLSAKVGESWGELKIVSLHGRKENPVSHVSANEGVFFLLDNEMNPSRVCRLLAQAGYEKAKVIIGERLSYEDEKITIGLAEEFVSKTFDSLSVMIVKNEEVSNKTSLGIGDDEFIRGKVPMTKEEVRTISISKLDIKEDDIIYDVGAGTGSVSIEMALLAKYGKVFAIETKKEAVELIKVNKGKFKAFNLEVIEGLAPEALKDLPAPDKVFIGGSKGNMEQIIRVILDKNPEAKFVINAIALETLNEVVNIFKDMNFQMTDILQLAVTRTKKVASYTMLDAINPIFIAVGKK